MSGSAARIYRFGDFQVEPDRRLLLRRCNAIALTPEALLHFVRNSGEVIEKEAMMRVIWPNTIVEENNLNQIISSLRRVLGEARGEHSYIAIVVVLFTP